MQGGPMGPPGGYGPPGGQMPPGGYAPSPGPGPGGQMPMPAGYGAAGGPPPGYGGPQGGPPPGYGGPPGGAPPGYGGPPGGPTPGAMVPAGPMSAALAHEITHGPSFGMLRVDLKPGELFISEAGSMVARNHSVEMVSKMNSPRSAGFFGKMKAFFVAMIRRIVGGETFFVNHFTSQQGGSVWVAPAMSGQVQHRRLNGERLVLSSGAYLAHSGAVDMRMRFGGIRGLLAKEGLFFVECSGFGDLWFTSYGGIEAIDINGSYIVDNGHMVGYEGQLTFTIRNAGGGMMGFIAGGEGLVCEFKGQGRVYVQSRNVSALVDWLTPQLPG